MGPRPREAPGEPRRAPPRQRRQHGRVSNRSTGTSPEDARGPEGAVGAVPRGKARGATGPSGASSLRQPGRQGCEDQAPQEAARPASEERRPGAGCTVLALLGPVWPSRHPGNPARSLSTGPGHSRRAGSGRRHRGRPGGQRARRVARAETACTGHPHGSPHAGATAGDPAGGRPRSPPPLEPAPPCSGGAGSPPAPPGAPLCRGLPAGVVRLSPQTRCP